MCMNYIYRFYIWTFLKSQVRDSLKLWEVHITWLLKFSSGIMDQKLTFGAQELFFISYYVEFLLSGLVSFLSNGVMVPLVTFCIS